MPQQLERILEIDRQIRAGRFPNADTISAQLGMSRRLIFNDKRYLVERLGAPIAYDRTRNGWYYSDSAWRLPAMVLSGGELLTFLLSLDLAGRYAGTALEPILRASLDNLAPGLGGRFELNLDLLAGQRGPGPAGEPGANPPGANPPGANPPGANPPGANPPGANPPGANPPGEDPPWLAVVQRAIHEQRPIRIAATPERTGPAPARQVEPALLFFLRGGWQMLGLEQGGSRLQIFPLQDLTDIELIS